MKGDGKYDSLAEFLSQLLQKVQNLETGNYSRTEIQLCVRQFQDYNEGFHYRMESKPRGQYHIMYKDAIILNETVLHDETKYPIAR